MDLRKIMKQQKCSASVKTVSVKPCVVNSSIAVSVKHARANSLAEHANISTHKEVCHEVLRLPILISVKYNEREIDMTTTEIMESVLL